MAIILDTDGFGSKTYGSYLAKNLYGALAAILPETQFVTTEAFDYQLSATNIEKGLLPRQKGLFHSQKTEKWLRQWEHPVFISLKRTLKASRSLKQVLIVADEKQLNDEQMMASTTVIGVVSEGLHLLFREKYPSLVVKSIRLDGIVSADIPANNDDMRDIFASGREYFIVADFNMTPDKLTTLLKGFSAFKRMLHSSWKLMLVLRSEEAMSKMNVEKLLSNYKYREDIVVTDESQLPEKIRDAYALVTVDLSERFPVPVMEAARVHTPVIAPLTHSIQHIFDDSVAYVENHSSEAIGEMLMKLYKDENLRKSLMERLKSRPVPGSKVSADALIQVLFP